MSRRMTTTLLFAIAVCTAGLPFPSRVAADGGPDAADVPCPEAARQTAVALNYCRASFHRIQRTPSKRVLIEEQEKILNNLNNVGAIEVNAFQSQADICMQKSIREGFGLTVSEALWKGRPTIGGDVGGIPLQITDGVSGYLVGSSEAAAQRSIEILEDPELAKRLGRAGKEHAREHFLTPRLLRDWLDLFTELKT